MIDKVTERLNQSQQGELQETGQTLQEIQEEFQEVLRQTAKESTLDQIHSEITQIRNKMATPQSVHPPYKVENSWAAVAARGNTIAREERSLKVRIPESYKAEMQEMDATQIVSKFAQTSGTWAKVVAVKKTNDGIILTTTDRSARDQMAKDSNGLGQII